MLKPVLTANWRYLAFLNFAVNPELLDSRVPVGTELDLYQGRSLLSLVGFLSADTVLVGQPPLKQRLFERVDLRFYVRQRNIDSWRRGTVLVRSIIPRVLASSFTHAFPGTPLTAASMRHDLIDRDGAVSVEYAWREEQKWQSFLLKAAGEPQKLAAGSHEDFVLDRSWSYTALPKRAVEYRLEHPRWRFWAATEWKLTAESFPSEFADILRSQPLSAFVGEGSHVQVQRRTTALDPA